MSAAAYSKDNYTARIYSQGKINLPVRVKDDLQVHDGDQILLIKKGSSWVITTRNAWIKDAQAYASTLDKKNVSLVDELITERRLAATKEGT